MTYENEDSVHVKKYGICQNKLFLVLIKKIVACGDENGIKHVLLHNILVYKSMQKMKYMVVSINYPYLISSNSPSGGIKLIARSVSNLLSFTHCKQTKRAVKNYLFIFTHKELQM